MADTRQDWYSLARLALMLFFIFLIWRADYEQNRTIRSLRQQLSQQCEGRK